LKERIVKNKRQAVLAIADIFVIYISILFGLLIRFDWIIPIEQLQSAAIHGVIASFIFLMTFLSFGLYRSLWEYAGSREILMIGLACLSATLVLMAIEYFLPSRLPLSVCLSLSVTTFLFVAGIRFSYRYFRQARKLRNKNSISRNSIRRRIMVVGAGDAGSIIIKEMLLNPSARSMPVVAVDDDMNKQGKNIHGIPITGGTGNIPELVKKYDIYEIIFAIPSAGLKQRKKILKICTETRCRLKTMPSVSELLNDDRLAESVREVRIEDLLGRNEVDLNILSIARFIRKKTILITGGGGSIGSEIARQVMGFDPARLVIMDIYENNAYELLNELNLKYSNGSHVEVVIASVRDERRIDDVFASFRPDVVFHAAAHKHVPLIEANPGEAVKNNVMGTLNCARAADKYGVKKFVLISTDKAVNPTNVMGATKRIAEMVVSSINETSNTDFVAVRFGNVLGSNGSVIPLFKKQIEAGGPITITHPDIRRYFMTISEASQLVIQAGAMAKGGEIFILDMGEMVKIMDLAKDLIRLSGLNTSDIQIKVTGLRPGEKLYEELSLDMASVERTFSDKIFIEKQQRLDHEDVLNMVEDLMDSIYEPGLLRSALAQAVPEFSNGKDMGYEPVIQGQYAYSYDIQ